MSKQEEIWSLEVAHGSIGSPDTNSAPSHLEKSSKIKNKGHLLVQVTVEAEWGGVYQLGL